MLGEEDIKENGTTYTTSVKCVSKEGTLIMIKKEDYIRLLSGQQNAWNVLEEKLNTKIDKFKKQ